MSFSKSHTSEPFTVNGVEKYATFEDDWFAEGASGYAYRGRIYTVNGWWFERGEQCVVKLYKEEYCKRLKETAWKVDDRASYKAHQMTKLFNNEPHYKDVARIEVLIPHISKVEKFATLKLRAGHGNPVPKTVRGSDAKKKKSADQMVPKDALIAIEHFLQGKYVHFLGNSGYVNPNVDTLVPVAFSHFTYHESGGEILVTDLQGIHNQNSYIFTDPAVHSMQKHGKKFGHYGPTDLGVYGVMKFFLDHQCNRLCEGLLKPDTSGIPIDLRGDLIKAIEAINERSYTTYTYELVKDSGLTGEELQKMHTNIAVVLTRSGSPIPQTVREFMNADRRAIGSRLLRRKPPDDAHSE